MTRTVEQIILEIEKKISHAKDSYLAEKSSNKSDSYEHGYWSGYFLAIKDYMEDLLDWIKSEKEE